MYDFVAILSWELLAYYRRDFLAAVGSRKPDKTLPCWCWIATPGCCRPLSFAVYRAMRSFPLCWREEGEHVIEEIQHFYIKLSLQSQRSGKMMTCENKAFKKKTWMVNSKWKNIHKSKYYWRCLQASHLLMKTQNISSK